MGTHRFEIPHFNVQPRLTWHFSSKIGKLEAKGGAKARTINSPIIVILHNFAGTEDNFSKHVELLNDLGYDVVTFDLSWHKHGGRKIFAGFIRQAWSKEVTDAYHEIIKVRPIIPFSFSGPSFCAIDAVAAIIENHPDKIKAMIFDSGPFENYHQCIKNMLSLYYKIKSKFIVNTLATGLFLAWDPITSKTTSRKFQKIFSTKPSLPILSLQGAQDLVIPMKYIQDLFSSAHPQNFKQVIFDKGSHLTSLKEEPEKYKQTLQKFLFDLG
jgi:pimeloyl-ACP methyl ester carboxylesterase